MFVGYNENISVTCGSFNRWHYIFKFDIKYYYVYEILYKYLCLDKDLRFKNYLISIFFIEFLTGFFILFLDMFTSNQEESEEEDMNWEWKRQNNC